MPVFLREAGVFVRPLRGVTPMKPNLLKSLAVIAFLTIPACGAGQDDKPAKPAA